MSGLRPGPRRLFPPECVLPWGVPVRRLAALLVVPCIALVLAPAASAQNAPGTDGKVSYKPPVEGPVVDEFRPPPEKWLAGNRGIDYTPGAGTAVRASADGEVTFAGQVGGELHVVVLHADGIRTSYSFLQSLAVHRGDRVRQGQTVGTSGESVHFGARVGDEYIDPRTLFDDGPPRVFLVPDEVKRPATMAAERGGLLRFLAKKIPKAWSGAPGVPQWLTSAVGTSWDEFKGLAHWAAQFGPGTHAARLGVAALDWWRQRKDCTPAEVAPPPIPERRVAVLVGGLGSNSESDSIDDVDPERLGYVDDVRFSYKGGTTTENDYGPEDTTVDLRTQAERLNEVLKGVARKHPGMPVDIIAHSQGGIIARQDLAYEYDSKDSALPRVANLVTLASPHQGTDAATVLQMTRNTMTGSLVQWGLHETGLLSFNPGGPSIDQLSETSEFIHKLNEKDLPEGINFTSVGSRGDIMVPGIHTTAPGARNVLVSLDGAWSDHSNLPGSAEGQREVALAIAGRPPTCQGLGDMLADTFVSDAIATAQDAAGAAAYVGARYFERRLP